MVDRTCTKPLSQSLQVTFQIIGREYKIDFTDAKQSIPGILLKPWLKVVATKEDWGKRILTCNENKNCLTFIPNPISWRDSRGSNLVHQSWI